MKDYPVSVTVSQAVNAAGNEVDIAAQNGKITVTKSSDGKEEVTTGDTAAVTMLFIMLCISGCVAFCMVRKKRNQKIKEV